MPKKLTGEKKKFVPLQVPAETADDFLLVKAAYEFVRGKRFTKEKIINMMIQDLEVSDPHVYASYRKLKLSGRAKGDGE